MASEIDEAAAEKHCRWIIANPGAFAGKDYAAHNAARAALAWKARAEENAEALAAAKAMLNGAAKAALDNLARAEAAEAERDSLRRQLAQAVKAR